MSLDKIQTCYATPSAGMHPSHTLPIKLRAIADAGFPNAEISFTEIEAFAKQESQKEGKEYRNMDDQGAGDVDLLVQAAGKIRSLCDELRIKIMALHPFSKFEGQINSVKREAGFSRARTFFKVLKALNCQTMQVGSNNDTDISDSFDKMANDLRELADEAAKQDPPVRIAYEMWAWGTYVNTWRHTWDICKRVNRENFGLCVDTFQVCARDYADPTSLSGLTSKSDEFQSSLVELTQTISPSKIYYLQISDAVRVDHVKLQRDATEKGMRPLFLWGSRYRPLPFYPKERVGYLPIVDVIEAVLKTGWRGPWSYEVFFAEDQAKDDPTVPERWTKAAAVCHQRIKEQLKTRGL